MKVSTVTLMGAQFPFIRAYSAVNVYTTVSTDRQMEDRRVKRRMEEYVSICMGFEIHFSGMSLCETQK